MARGRRLIVRVALGAAALLAALFLIWPEPDQPDRSGESIARQIVVAIDPGHGGIDPGASAEGLTEKQVALRFSRRLADQIAGMKGYTAVLLRADDSFLTLTQRIRRARAEGANLLVSIHADSTREGLAEGAHVYTLSPDGTDDAAAELALRENRTDVLGGVELAGESDDLTALLVDMAQRGTQDESAKLATAVLRQMAGSVTLLPTEPHRQANFRILKAPEIPSILVELGYLSNPGDRQRIASDDWTRRMTRALARGIDAWTRIASPGYLASKK